MVHDFICSRITRVLWALSAVCSGKIEAMNVDLLITAGSTTVGVAIGAASAITIEQLRRRHESESRRREERKAVYAAFMTAVVQWQNAIAWRGKRRFGPSDSAYSTAGDDQMVEQAHQSAMGPPFELRMIGTPDVRAAAERIMIGVYEYQKAFEEPSPDVDLLDARWQEGRDNFIEQARRELEA